MPRFHFNFVNADVAVPDEQGTDLETLANAHQHAVALVGQATSYFDRVSEWRGWTVCICSPEGRPLLTVLFPARHRDQITESSVTSPHREQRKRMGEAGRIQLVSRP